MIAQLHESLHEEYKTKIKTFTLCRVENTHQSFKTVYVYYAVTNLFTLRSESDSFLQLNSFKLLTSDPIRKKWRTSGLIGRFFVVKRSANCLTRNNTECLSKEYFLIIRLNIKFFWHFAPSGTACYFIRK